MPLVLADRVKETTTTTGTGTVTLLGAVTGYQSFSAIGNANTTYYCIAGQTTSEWEVGIGTYTSAGTTLSRDTVLASSNAGALVTFSAGTKDVFVTYPAGRSVYASGTTLVATNSSILPVSSGGSGASTLTGYVKGNGTSAFTASASIPNSDTTATSANTASAIVARDASGNFSAGTITATLSGNASTATSATSATTATNATNVAITDDTTTNATYYPAFMTATSGNGGVRVSSTKLTYNPSTGALSSTTVAGSSDERLKTNWRSLPNNFIEELAQVKAGIYDRTDHDVPITQVGVTAQSLQAVLPDAVISDNDGMLSVAYGNAALVSAIELAKRVVEQEARINRLEALVAKLIGD